MTQLAQIIASCQQLWPEKTAASWDQVGLAVGDLSAPVHKIVLAVDADSQIIDNAIAAKVDLIITHHPLLMRAINSVTVSTGKGSNITKLIQGGCALYAAHTNADIPAGGVSDVIAQRLKLQGTKPLQPSEHDVTVGIGRVGALAAECMLQEFADRLAGIFPVTAGGIKVAGDAARKIRRVSLCGGAGDSLLYNREVLASDVYITSDLRHHPAQEFVENSRVSGGPALIDVAHWAAESLWLETAAAQLRELLPEIEVRVDMTRTDPWSFTVGQTPGNEGV
ncbi:Nif3-like dinuclear metal center hexameric protein [Canibacter sp. lx-45]|uniref:Nif3-like dinuclear metal center hexameric protein n=1 Tax=Canibacter zhuwentaonis TaxID=2837491 RepID=UPI001BDC0C2A|nr:Nif3-like dinuclear metal center hexameric protein [Canibacter zhuwentaonis]MBT1035160.1 Nif3-like dinuclear metal center hexameric protein [Canibacter zhuwentaonis]